MLAVLLVGAAVATLSGTDDGEPRDLADVFVPSGRVVARPVPIETGDVVAPPWRGVFEHHPVVGAAPDVDTVHVVSLAGDPSSARPAGAVLVVDATRRANVEGELPKVRMLGQATGRGLRTLQWDAPGYGISLTATGMLLDDQERLADAVAIPGGSSLLHGRPPVVAPAALEALGLSVADVRSGPATTIGGPLIGQSGIASIEAQLHRPGSGTVLVSIVRAQVTPARAVADALGEAVAVPVRGLDGVTAAAVLVHPGPPITYTRVRGWTRLLLDHGDDVTIEISSDVLGARDLVAAAVALDLDRLSRTVRADPG